MSPAPTRVAAIASFLHTLESNFVPGIESPPEAEPPDSANDADAINHGWLPIERSANYPTHCVLVVDEEYAALIEMALAHDEAALDAQGCELLRPFGSEDTGLAPDTAVLRIENLVVQLSGRPTTHYDCDIGRVGAVEMACDLIAEALGGSVSIADLAAALDPAARDAMEKALRRLNNGHHVHRRRLKGVGWGQLAFSHPAVQKPGARRRRKLANARRAAE